MDGENKNESPEQEVETVTETTSSAESTTEQAAPNTSATEDKKEGTHKTLMGVLAYLGPLVIIPFLMAQDEPFVKFHIKQGLVLLIISIILWVAHGIAWSLWPIWNLLNLMVFIFAIIGIVNVLRGKEEELPLVGQYAEKIKV